MLMENDYLNWCGGSNPSFPVLREMAKLVAAIDAKMYLDNFSLWRTILIGKEVDYYSTGRNPLGVRVPRPPFNNYGRVAER